MRWLQFNLKSLLILVLVVALPCSWLAWKMDRKRRERAAVSEIKKLGGFVVCDYQDYSNEPPGPAWIRAIAGDDFFANVDFAVLRCRSKTDDFANLDALTKLRGLDVAGPAITDGFVYRLTHFHSLEKLTLWNTTITATGLRHLGELPKLNWLILDDGTFTDQSLLNLNECSKLTKLQLLLTQVTET